MTEAPRLIVTAGLHGSASTAVFNIVRELMAQTVGAENLVAVFSEDLSHFPEPLAVEHRHVVLKSHSGSPAWHWLVALTSAPVILTIRDPRDAVVSMIERFAMPPDQAVRTLAADCRLVVRCVAAGHMPLRYEDRFYDDETLPAQLASRLGLNIEDAFSRALGRRYGTEGVRAIARSVGERRPGRMAGNGSTQYDTVTQIHAAHIGDGLSGKWRDRLPAGDGAALTRFFGPFLARFGYEA